MISTAVLKHYAVLRVSKCLMWFCDKINSTNSYLIEAVNLVLSFMMAVRAYSLVINVELLLIRILSKTSNTSSSVTLRKEKIQT